VHPPFIISLQWNICSFHCKCQWRKAVSKRRPIYITISGERCRGWPIAIVTRTPACIVYRVRIFILLHRSTALEMNCAFRYECVNRPFVKCCDLTYANVSFCKTFVFSLSVCNRLANHLYCTSCFWSWLLLSHLVITQTCMSPIFSSLNYFQLFHQSCWNYISSAVIEQCLLFSTFSELISSISSFYFFFSVRV